MLILLQFVIACYYYLCSYAMRLCCVVNNRLLLAVREKKYSLLVNLLSIHRILLISCSVINLLKTEFCVLSQKFIKDPLVQYDTVQDDIKMLDCIT